MTDENQNQEKTFTQADIDNLNAEHQKAMDALAGKLRAEAGADRGDFDRKRQGLRCAHPVRRHL